MSKIRLFKATPCYDNYLKRFYAEHPGLDTAPYDTQLTLLMGDCFGWSDHWKTHLETTSKFEVQEVICNAAPLQKQWAKENGVSYSEANWLRDIVLAQARAFRPDIFFPHDYYNLHADLRHELKRDFPKLLVLGYDGIALNDPNRFDGCDIMLSCIDSVVDFYRQAGFQAHLFRTGFETSIAEKLQLNREIHDTTFSGSIVQTDWGHHTRAQLLANICKKIPVELWLEMQPAQSFLSEQIDLLRHGHLKTFTKRFFQPHSPYHFLSQRNHGSLFGLSMFQILADSKIVLNAHIDATGVRAGNMRLFEATGVGACLVTDWKENLHEIFDLDREVVVYRSAEECVDKLKHLLAHPDERRAIAAAGKKRTWSHHSFAHYLSPIQQLLIDEVAKRS